MNPRVSVGMSHADALFGCSVGAAVLALVGLVVAAALEAETSLLVLLGGLAVLFAVTAVARSAYIRKHTRFITPTADGFTVEDRNGTFEFTDDAVSDLATWAKVRYSNGKPAANKRTGSFTISAGEASARFAFGYEYKLNATDPLGAMLQRVFDKLVERTKADLDAGNRLDGDGWSLSTAELTVAGRQAAEDDGIPVRQIAAVDVVDNKVCVWLRGQDEASLKVAADSPNALVMGRVLQDRMPPAAEEPPPADGLGRVIFQRDHSTGPAALVAGFLFAVLVACVGLGMVLANLLGGGEPWMYVVGPLVALVAVGGAWYLWAERVKVFRVQAYGVSYRRSRGTKELRYKDAGTFTYTGVRNYYNGAYTGTSVNLTFVPRAGQDGDTVVYAATFKNADEELDNLRDFVSRVIAGHMFARLQNGESVQWTPGLLFHPDGLEFHRGGWFGSKKAAEKAAYADLGNYTFENGTFYLSLRGETKWAVQEPVNKPNFFPGFVLLMMILNPPAADTPPAGPTEPAAGDTESRNDA